MSLPKGKAIALILTPTGQVIIPSSFETNLTSKDGVLYRAEEVPECPGLYREKEMDNVVFPIEPERENEME